MSEVAKQISSNIKKHGWHCTHVFEDDASPSFHYTVGLEESYGHPEILVFGIQAQAGHQIICDLVKRISEGESFPTDQPLTDVIGGGYKVVFRDLNDPASSQFLLAAKNYYSGGFRCVVLFWPDKRGLFPWEDHCNSPSQIAGLNLIGATFH